MVLPEGKAETGTGDDNIVMKYQFEDSDVQELLRERTVFRKNRHSLFYNEFANTFRLLSVMVPEDNGTGRRFFTFGELGYYKGNLKRLPLRTKEREVMLARAKELGWVKETKLPPNMRRRVIYKDKDIDTIVNSPMNEHKKTKRMREERYFSITEEGKRIYKNLK